MDTHQKSEAAATSSVAISVSGPDSGQDALTSEATVGAEGATQGPTTASTNTATTTPGDGADGVDGDVSFDKPRRLSIPVSVGSVAEAPSMSEVLLADAASTVFVGNGDELHEAQRASQSTPSTPSTPTMPLASVGAPATNSDTNKDKVLGMTLDEAWGTTVMTPQHARSLPSESPSLHTIRATPQHVSQVGSVDTSPVQTDGPPSPSKYNDGTNLSVMAQPASPSSTDEHAAASGQQQQLVRPHTTGVDAPAPKFVLPATAPMASRRRSGVVLGGTIAPPPLDTDINTGSRSRRRTSSGGGGGGGGGARRGKGTVWDKFATTKKYRPDVPTQYQPRFVGHGWSTERVGPGHMADASASMAQDPAPSSPSTGTTTSNALRPREPPPSVQALATALRPLGVGSDGPQHRFRPPGNWKSRCAFRTESWRARNKKIRRAMSRERESELRRLPRGWQKRIVTPDLTGAREAARANSAAVRASARQERLWLHEVVEHIAGCFSSLSLIPAARTALLKSQRAMVVLASIATTDALALGAGRAVGAGHGGGRGADPQRDTIELLCRDARRYALETLSAAFARLPRSIAFGANAMAAALGSALAHTRPWHGATFGFGGRVPHASPAMWLPVALDLVMHSPMPAALRLPLPERHTTDPDDVNAVSLKSWVTLHGMVAVVGFQLLHDYNVPAAHATTDFEIEDGCEAAAAASHHVFGPTPAWEPMWQAPCELETWMSGVTNALSAPGVLLAALRVTRWIMSPSQADQATHHESMAQRVVAATHSVAPRVHFTREAVTMAAVLCADVHALIRYHEEMGEEMSHTSIGLVGETIEVLTAMMWCPRKEVALAAARALANLLYVPHHVCRLCRLCRLCRRCPTCLLSCGCVTSPVHSCVVV